jgi:hypothetical protein
MKRTALATLLTLLALMAVLGLEPCAAAGESPAKDRFNVLFIISDDLTATALSCYGNEVCHTPNIDRIASRGTRFTRAYCQGTYCGPSRASFMSGYGEDAAKGVELFDMHKDPKQYTNLAGNPEYKELVEEFKAKMTAKLKAVRANDL